MIRYVMIVDEKIGFKDLLIKKFSFSFFGFLRETKASIFCNGKLIRINDTVYPNDNIVIEYEPIKQIGNLCDDPIKILYEDDDCIVIDKDVGRSSVPSHTHQYDTVYNCLLKYFQNTSSTIHFISRLDKDTSGVLLVAKNQISACLFNKNSNEHIKEYICDTYNKMPFNNGIIEEPIRRSVDNKRWVFADGHYAKTSYKLIDKVNDFYRYSVRIYTGRTHQIRVHFAYNNCPLVNDILYGSNQIDGPMHLHAHYLKFYHPIKKEWIEIHSQCPF